jgi:hypothetical protein
MQANTGNGGGAKKKGHGKKSNTSKAEPPPKNYVDAESVYQTLKFLFFNLKKLTMQLTQIISERK